MKSKLNIFSIIALASGLTSSISFQLLGQLFLGELLLSALGIILLLDKFIPSTRKSQKNILDSPFFINFLLFFIITFLGLAISDFWQNTPTLNYLRGWSRLIFLTLDTIALSYLGSQNKWNFIYLSLGSGIGSILTGFPFLDVQDGWKLNYAFPITLLLLCIFPLINKYSTPLVFIALGAINIFFDTRSMGLFCVLIAAIIWIKILPESQTKERIPKIFLSLFIALLTLAYVYQNTQDEFSKRRENSNVGRFASLQIAIQAIAESPIIGHGSWAKNGELAEKYLDLVDGTRGFNTPDRVYAQTVIPSHSQILQSWIEGGILGVTFFVFYGYQTFLGLVYLIFQRQYDQFAPLFLFCLINSAWNLFSSPFSGSHRIPIAITIGVLCILNFEKNQFLESSMLKKIKNQTND